MGLDELDRIRRVVVAGRVAQGPDQGRLIVHLGLGRVAGDIAGIHGVDLGGRQVVLRVLRIHLIANENVEQVGVGALDALRVARVEGEGG